MNDNIIYTNIPTDIYAAEIQELMEAEIKFSVYGFCGADKWVFRNEQTATLMKCKWFNYIHENEHPDQAYQLRLSHG